MKRSVKSVLAKVAHTAGYRLAQETMDISTPLALDGTLAHCMFTPA